MTSKGALFAVAVLVVCAAFILRRGHQPSPQVAADDTADVAPPPAPPPPAHPAPPPESAPRVRQPPAPPAGPTEAALMAQLRDLGASDPARALTLAREGNRRFPEGPGAAERSWTICKSLAALGRAAEAQDEARRMVDQYPGTEWANDVRRHLLTQPLQHPKQRGYGRPSELD